MMRYTVNALASVFAVIYTALSLYACSAPPPQVITPVSNVPIEPERGIVSILQSRPEISQSLQSAIDLYSAANPGSHINVTTVSGVADYHIALRSRLLAGERVDVFHLFSGLEAREMKSYLEDLSELEWISGAACLTADPVTIDGHVYGIPYSLECAGLIANRNIFEQAGIPIAWVTTLPELEEACAELRSQIADGSLGEAFPALSAVTDLPVQDKTYLGSLAADIVLTGEFETPSQTLSQREIKIPAGTGAEDLFTLMKRYSPKGDWTEQDGLPWLAQLEAFASGKIAVLLCDRAGVEQILALNPKLEGRIELLPIPIPGREQSAVYTGTPLWWGVSSGSSDPAKLSAKRFLTWLYQSESGSAVVAARFGVVSPWLEPAKETGKSFDRQMLSLVGSGRTLPQIWREFPYWWGVQTFADGLRSWYAGETQWEPMLQKLKEGWAYG